METKEFNVGGIEFKCRKFNAFDSLKISKRVMAYLAMGFAKGVDKEMVKKMVSSESKEGSENAINLEQLGNIVLTISDEDLEMIFTKCILITEVKRDGTYTKVAVMNGSQMMFCHDDISELLSNIANQIKLLYEVLGYNFFSSLKDISLNFKKPA